MDLSFIIVNHKSDTYLAACLASLVEAAFSFTHEVIVVHNDQEVHPLLSLPSHIPLQVHQTNQVWGYAQANNWGATFAQGKILCFLNPDTLILEGAFAQILTLLEKDFGIAGPKLVIDHHGNVQPWSAGTAVTPWQTIKNNLGLGQAAKLWQESQTKEVAWVSGACLFVRQNLFTQLQGFDENFFLYFEDVDLCRRAKALQQKILFVPTATVLHWGGKSQASSQQQKGFYYASQDYYFQKHFGTTWRLCIQVLRVLFGKKA